MKQFSLIYRNLQKLIYFSIILFLPTQLGLHFWPFWSYVSGIRVDYLSPTIYFTDVLTFLLFPLVILNLFQDPRQKKILKRVQNDIFKNWKLIAVIAFLLIGVISSKSPQAGMYGILKFLEFCFFCFYTAGFMQKKKHLQQVIILFSFGVLFETFLAGMQYVHQGSMNGLFYFLGERAFTSQTPGIANATINGSLLLRPYGTFPHPNVLAGYLTIAMAMVIFNFQFLIFNQISNLKKLIFLTTLLIGTIALFLTMSRIAILLWIIIVMLNLFQHLMFSRTRFRNKFGMTVLLILVATIFLLSPLRFRFGDFRLADESVVARAQLMQTAIAMIRAHPVFGVGIDNFLQNVSEYQKLTTQVSLFSYLQPVHNIFFLIASEVGIAGLLGVLVFLGKTISHLKKKKEFSIFNFQFSILAIVLFLGMFDHYFLTLQQGQLLFAFVLGFCWSDK